MKDVMIRILAVQTGDDLREQTVLAEFSTEGKMDFRDGSGTLTYPESELTGMEGTVTTFRLEDGKVTQQGTHDELIHQSGLYSKIFNIQTALEEEFKGVNIEKIMEVLRRPKK